MLRVPILTIVRCPIVVRQPIVLRCPITRRCQIMQRYPIVIDRIPITTHSNRKPICLNRPKYKTCPICYGRPSCSGVKEYRNLTAMKLTYNGKALENALWTSSLVNEKLRLIIDMPIPHSLIQDASYHPWNILQINVNILNSDTRWVSDMVNTALFCGMIVQIFVFPIIPKRVMSWRVLQLVNQLKTFKGVDYLLNFAEGNVVPLVADGFANVGGTMVPIEYLEITKTGWRCSEHFKERFTHYIATYADPRKIKWAACSNQLDCEVIYK